MIRQSPDNRSKYRPHTLMVVATLFFSNPTLAPVVTIRGFQAIRAASSKPHRQEKDKAEHTPKANIGIEIRHSVVASEKKGTDLRIFRRVFLIVLL